MNLCGTASECSEAGSTISACVKNGTTSQTLQLAVTNTAPTVYAEGESADCVDSLEEIHVPVFECMLVLHMYSMIYMYCLFSFTRRLSTSLSDVF